MKLKITLLALIICSGIYAAWGCSYRSCGGGNDKCCVDAFGATYYLTKGE